MTVDVPPLTTDDDTFHPPTDDPWWTETVWFAWMVPERNLLGYFYPVFRPNVGVQFGGILVMDDTAELPWEIPVFDFGWHARIPDGLDLRDARLDNGMWLRAVEPTRVYEFGYEGRDLSVDLRYEGVVEPLVTHATPPFNKGHIDQIGRVTGTMTLRGETIAVDCHAMRDRAWGPRQDGPQPKVGYAYATASPDHAFLAISIDKQGDDLVSHGFLQRDREWHPVVDGRRAVERDARGRPARITVDARDAAGRAVHAVGTPVARQVFTAYPSMFCWNSLVHWSVDGDDAWGEDQDVWHPRKWRDFAASLRAPS